MCGSYFDVIPVKTGIQTLLCHAELVSASTKKRSRNKFGMTKKRLDSRLRRKALLHGSDVIPAKAGIQKE
ncbi:hypothetical protein [Rickettsia endosymbiont of Orchestes rusci]|uniref:hypothetical protein n=1 Tax=Rickettsia endosymbiont of Orchestes rusci TaxID=3066250 RepID=UPI00313B20E8